MGSFCIGTDMPNADAGMLVLDESGLGELTVYGDHVTDRCFGVCHD
jgi:hypothetical protein